MRRFAFAVFLLLAAIAPAQAWNSKGHMVICRLAWNELTPAERAQVTEILKRHPHYDEYLKADRPADIPEDEWAFMRAGTWSDWVRGDKHKEFNRPAWHYINLPIVPPGDPTVAPMPPDENIVTRIAASKAFVKNGTQEERAIHLCWLLHLIGDIHQPLHCTALFSTDFPKGDRGGNRSLLRIDGRVIQLHSFWDGLLGNSVTPGTLNSATREIEELLREKADAIKADLDGHLTVKEWAQEGLETAKRLIYQDGAIKPADSDRHPPNDAIPNQPETYAKEAGAAARLCVAKAGRRMAATLREVLAEK